MALKLTKEVFIVGAKRTPFGGFGGALKDFVMLSTIALTKRQKVFNCVLFACTRASAQVNCEHGERDACLYRVELESVKMMKYA